MNKKILFSSLAVILLIVGGFGLKAFASPSSSATVSTSLTGTYKTLSADQMSLIVQTDQGDTTLAIATSVWVYRNDQKAQLSDLKQGDTVEVILNNKKQAAYVKAYAADATSAVAESEQEQTQLQPSAVQPSTTPVPTSTPITASPTPAPSGPTASNPTETQALDRLNLKIEGEHFSLELKRNAGQGNSDDLKIKSKEGGDVHVKGEAATAWITQLLAGARLTEQNAKEQLLNAIAAQYKEDKSKLGVKYDAKWLPAPHAVEKPKPHPEDKGNKGKNEDPKKARPGVGPDRDNGKPHKED